MLNCYCQLSSSVIFRQYGVSQSECKIDRPRPGLLVSPLVLTLKPWERGCLNPCQSVGCQDFSEIVVSSSIRRPFVFIRF